MSDTIKQDVTDLVRTSESDTIKQRVTDLSTLTYSRVRVLAQRSPLDEGPLPLAPGRVRAVSSFGL